MSETVRASEKKSEAAKEERTSHVQKSNYSQPANSSIDHILFLQRTLGNQAVGMLIKSGALQAKLKIEQPDDIYEQEADRVAEQVMWIPASVQRKCPECEDEVHRQPEKEEEENAQTKPILQRDVTSSFETSEEFENRLHSARGGGAPLPTDIRGELEPKFGADFSGVRVHTGNEAAELNKQVQAKAFTHGRDIHFGAGQYDPGSKAGKELQLRAVGNYRLTVIDSQLYPRPVSRQELGPDEPPHIEGNFELDPQRFLKSMEAYAPKEEEKCENFPGGSTDCEMDETGTPTGKVTHRIDETNPCTRPCVEQHETVHVRQLKTFCPQLRECYLAADKGKRPFTDCYKMAIFGIQERECEAYKVSVPCMENRLKGAKECQSKTNKEYGTRKLTSEKCFRDKNCGS